MNFMNCDTFSGDIDMRDLCSGFNSSETQTGEADFRIYLWIKVKSDHPSLRRYLPDISNISFINYELDWLGTGLQGKIFLFAT